MPAITSLYILSLVLHQLCILFIIVTLILWLYSLLSLRDSNAYSFMTFECGFDCLVYQNVFANYFIIAIIFLVLEIEYLVVIITVSSGHPIDSS